MVLDAAQQRLHTVDILVEDKRKCGPPPYRQAFLVGRARLLDVDVEVANRGDNACRFVHRPARVRVGNQQFTGRKDFAALADTQDVLVGIAADLQLEFRVAFLAITVDLLRHDLGRLLRDRPIELEVPLLPAPEQPPDGHARRPAQNVPARVVDRGLDVRMPAQQGVHRAVQHAELGRIAADELWRDLPQPGAHAAGISGQVRGTERGAFAIAADPGVGFDFDDGRVEHRHAVVIRPVVAALLQRQVHLIHVEVRDFHRLLFSQCSGGGRFRRQRTDFRNWTVSGSRGAPITCSGGPIS